MRRVLVFAALVLAVVLALVGCGDDGRELRPPAPGATAPPLSTTSSAAPAAVNPAGASALALTSTAFQEGAPIPARHTCDGENLSPPLAWSSVPQATAELAITMTDPDAGGFVHWVVTGLDPSSTGIGEGAVPEAAAEGRNDSSEFGWFGPCPPEGDAAHHYVFTLYASTQPVTPDPEQSPRDAIAAIAAVPGVATTLSGTYERSA